MEILPYVRCKDGCRMNKKYYDGGIVTEILFTHLEAEKMLEVLTAFAEAKGVDAVEVVRCKDCKYYREDGDCWHEWDNDGRIYYQSIINEPNPDDYCSRAKRREE